MSFLPIQTQNFSLSGAGCSIGDTVLNLKSFKDILGNTIAMSDIGSIGFMTIEPGNGTQEEQISFTGVTQNSDGSAQLTGIKSVIFKSPYTSTTGFRVTHPGSVVAILSNTAAFYNQFAILANDEAITGNWTAPDPTALQGIATKNYVLAQITSGGTLQLNGLVAAGTAGATLAAGNLVYFKPADGRWYKTDATDTTTINGVILGIAQGAGTAGNAITNGVLLKGVDANQLGLVAGTLYYAANTAGTIATTAGTNERAIGRANSNTTLYFDPTFFYLPTATQKTALGGLTSSFTAGETITTNDALGFFTAASGTKSATLVNGSAQYFSATNNYNNTTGSIDFWVKFNTLPSILGHAVGLVTAANNSGLQGFALTLNNAGGTADKIQAYFGAGGNVITALAAVVTGTWYYVVYRWNPLGSELLINNVSQGTATAATLASGNANVFVGTDSTATTRYLDGKIMNVRVWNTYLTNDLLNSYRYANLTTAPGLQANWTLNNTVNDASGNANNLTNNNAATFTTDVPTGLTTSTAGTIYKASSLTGANATFAGFALNGGIAGTTIIVQSSGRLAGFTSLSPGTRYYLTDTAGAIGAPGTVAEKVGTAISSTELLIDNNW